MPLEKAPSVLKFDYQPIEPVVLRTGFSINDFDEVLAYGAGNGVSDFCFQTDDYVWADIHGRQRPLTARKVQKSEIESMVSAMCGPSAIGTLAGGADIDMRWEVRVDRMTKMAFRVNITPARVGNVASGISMTLRSLPSEPPPIANAGLSDELRSALFIESGMALIVGATGSGKSTLQASVIRERLENNEDRKILTYENPVEFTFEKIKCRVPMPSQTEIGVTGQLPSYAAACRNALRRKPSIIQIGEARDAETMDGIIEVALTGHAAYSTVHARTPSDTINRIIQVFPHEAHSAAASKILGCLKLIVAQKLVKTNDGRRVALREWVYLDPPLKELMEQNVYTKWPLLIREAVADRFESFEKGARKLLKAGLITPAEYLDASELPPNGEIPV